MYVCVYVCNWEESRVIRFSIPSSPPSSLLPPPSFARLTQTHPLDISISLHTYIYTHIQTDALASKIDNRKKVQKKLNGFVGRMSISKQLVDAIVKSPMGETFLLAVSELHDKLQFVEKLPPNTPSLGDVIADMNSLRTKVGWGEE